MPAKPDRRKIAVVIPKYGLTGGAEGFTAELTERLAANPRYDIHVFANRWSGSQERITFHKVPIIAFPKFLTTISFAWFARRLISRMDFDLIHAHDRIFRADIFTMHGIPHRLWVREIRKKAPSLYDLATAWVERKLVMTGGCRFFLAVSELAKGKFLEAYEIDPRRVQVLSPGVDAGRFRGLDRTRCRIEVRGRYAVDDNSILIIFVSMNFEVKGLDRLMQAMAALRSAGNEKKFTLLVVGKGNVPKYSALARRLNIPEAVVFAGVLGKDDLDKAYLASDAFAILSTFDTFGLVVLEAMAASLPAIVSTRVGAKDAVRDGINGFIIAEKEDIKELGEKMLLLADRERRLSMGQEARKTAEAFTWEKATESLEKIYEAILQDPQGLRSETGKGIF